MTPGASPVSAPGSTASATTDSQPFSQSQNQTKVINKVLYTIIYASLLAVGWAEGSTGLLANKLTEVRAEYVAKQERLAAEERAEAERLAQAQAAEKAEEAARQAAEMAEAWKRQRQHLEYSAKKAAVRELEHIVIKMQALRRVVYTGDWLRYRDMDQQLQGAAFAPEILLTAESMRGFTLFHRDDFSEIDPREVLAFMKKYRDEHLPANLERMGPDFEHAAKSLTWMQAAEALKYERQKRARKDERQNRDKPLPATLERMGPELPEPGR